MLFVLDSFVHAGFVQSTSNVISFTKHELLLSSILLLLEHEKGLCFHVAQSLVIDAHKLLICPVRYIPKYYLRFEYPDDYEVQDAVPCDGGAMTPEQDKKTKSKRRKQAGESVTTRRTARRARKTSEV